MSDDRGLCVFLAVFVTLAVAWIELPILLFACFVSAGIALCVAWQYRHRLFDVSHAEGRVKGVCGEFRDVPVRECGHKPRRYAR